MDITFCISAGTILTDDGRVVTTRAFAGNDSRPDVNPDHVQGRNNPAFVQVRSIGPLPPAVYRCGTWQDHPHLGPLSCPLTAIPGTGEQYGRDGFWIHGPGADVLNSSEGCVVVPHDARVQIRILHPEKLTVVA